MHESDCDVSSVNYRAGLCLPSVRPGTIAYLWVVRTRPPKMGCAVPIVAALCVDARGVLWAFVHEQIKRDSAQMHLGKNAKLGAVD